MVDATTAGDDADRRAAGVMHATKIAGHRYVDEGGMREAIAAAIREAVAAERERRARAVEGYATDQPRIGVTYHGEMAGADHSGGAGNMTCSRCEFGRCPRCSECHHCGGEPCRLPPSPAPSWHTDPCAGLSDDERIQLGWFVLFAVGLGLVVCVARILLGME
jgi:hypothetical protein